jgi:hypothetical protein
MFYGWGIIRGEIVHYGLNLDCGSVLHEDIGRIYVDFPWQHGRNALPTVIIRLPSGNSRCKTGRTPDISIEADAGEPTGRSNQRIEQ